MLYESASKHANLHTTLLASLRCARLRPHAVAHRRRRVSSRICHKHTHGVSHTRSAASPFRSAHLAAGTHVGARARYATSRLARMLLRARATHTVAAYGWN
eukprot:1601815-Pleurochrysis_carterae.AAC.2